MIKITYAYGDLLGLYGEYANVEALDRRLNAAGDDAEIRTVRIGEALHLGDADLLYIGAGTEGKMISALSDIKKHAADIKSYVDAGGFALLTGNAAALLSDKVVTADGAELAGLGVLDAAVVIDDRRRYAEFIARCDMVKEKVVGSINTSLTVTSGEKPLFDILFSSADILGKKTEGARKNNLFATELSGPLLVRNPALLDWLASALARRELPSCGEGWYRFAESGYKDVLATLEKAAKKR